MKFTTIAMIGGVAGGLAGYFNSEDIQQAGELLRVGGASAMGVGSAAGAYLGVRVYSELFGSQGLFPMVFALATSAAVGYGGYEASEAIAGNVISEQAATTVQPLAPANN